jgi:hypothetical protein
LTVNSTKGGGVASSREQGELIGGRYRVDSTLGEGGMGTVLRVFDEREKVFVALKRVHSGSERAKIALFEQEYFTLSELAHPRIIDVYDYGVEARGAFYTMELLDGADLRDLRGMDWRAVCTILSDVACSLAILHSRGFLHRDVSPRNVRRTSDGRAKLLDFGAMARVGTSRDLVGTPPCVAPEVLHGQPCDGRADLYALGVVGYWLLTGRYPYPARSFIELQDVWASPPPSVRELAPDVPPDLAELVGELIALEPHARPRTAGEVVERLSAAGGFELSDVDTFGGAYLTLPTLVGRDDFIAWVRPRLRAVSEGQGGVFVIEGEPGIGLSRALRAAVAESKRLGHAVASASAVDAGTGDFGVVKALAQQVIRSVPEADGLLTARQRTSLRRILTEDDASTFPMPERRHVQVALRDWLLEVGSQRPLTLMVDDAEAADEPSLALLALLAERLKRARVVVMLALHTGPAEGLALEVISRFAEPHRLLPLSAAANEELVRSIFGNVGNVVRAAQTVHERARGKPRDAMAYLGHLVERGAARYEGAAWVLSDVLDDTDLPSSIGAVLAARFQGLGADAKQLARALALADPSWLGVADYGALVDLGGARVFRAIDALVSARILVEDGSGHAFQGRTAPEFLTTGIDASWKATVHARLARVAERRNEPLRRLHHLIESGQASRAVEELVVDYGTETLEYTAASIDLLERALAATCEQPIPELWRMELRLRLIGVAAMVGDLDTFFRHAPAELERLCRDSGLRDWETLPAETPPPERVQRALGIAHDRHVAAPELERGFPPFEALRRLARLCAGYQAMAGAASDRSLLDDLPSLLPFSMLSPALALVDASIEASKALEEGRVVSARTAFGELLERVSSAEGLEPAHRDQMRYGWTYVIGSIDAIYGLPSCLEFAADLERVPRYRSAAWHMRRSYFRMLGKFDRAEECQRQMELLELRDGPQSFRSVNFRIEIVSSILSDDVVALKNLAATVDLAAKRLPRLRVIAEQARAHYHRIRGEYPLALECLTSILDLAKPNTSLDWVSTAATHVDLLVLNGMVEEACAQADAYIAVCVPTEHSTSELETYRTRALSAAGRWSEAAAVCDAVIRSEEQRGTRGLRLASCYKIRARIALASKDDEAFARWANRFVEFCETTESSTMRAQASRLTRDGRAAGIVDLREIELPTTRREGAERAEAQLARLSASGDRAERARLALSMAMETFGAERGYLYAFRGTALERLLSIPPDADEPECLTTQLENIVASAHDTMTAFSLAPVAEQSPQGATYHVRPLYSDLAGPLTLAGAVALCNPRKVPSGLSSKVLKSIADALLEQDGLEQSKQDE